MDFKGHEFINNVPRKLKQQLARECTSLFSNLGLNGLLKVDFTNLFSCISGVEKVLRNFVACLVHRLHLTQLKILVRLKVFGKAWESFICKKSPKTPGMQYSACRTSLTEQTA